jgi:O-antigen/teichoic acid export membrane protein
VFVRVTRSGLKILLTLAIPAATGLTLVAEPLIRAFAGSAYLPHSAAALQILAWVLPLSFVNGLLQYTLIAANQQRFITLSFVVAVTFNVGVNLVLIPSFGYVGAAWSTIASEIVLLAPFLVATRRHVGSPRLLALAWRPAVASAGMAPVVALGSNISPLLAVALGAATYGALLTLIGGVNAEERAVLRRMVRRVRAV